MATETHSTRAWGFMSRARAPLPFERAFVIQIRGDAEVRAGAISGRIEHLSSGAVGGFESVEELVAWMGDAIARTTPSGN